MRIIIRHLKGFQHDKRGVSNVLVVMLSLVLVTVIVANVVLWSYQMNQYDWERAQENLKLINAERNYKFLNASEIQVINGSHLGGLTFREEKYSSGNTSGSNGRIRYLYPSGYNTLGGTQHVDGSPSDLEADDGSCMIFRSYKTQEITDYVDQQSNVDGNPDKGTHSNFAALRATDSIYDALTEANTGGNVEYYLATRDTPFGTNSLNYVDYMSLSFTSVTNAKYFVLAYIELTGSSTSRQALCQFLQGSTFLARYADRPRVANTEVMPQMFAYIYTGTGGSVTFKWQIASSAGSATATAVRGRIYAIRLDNLPNADYQSVYDSTERSNMDNAWGDDTGDTYEITINPSSTAYYLIWASAKVESDSTLSSVSVRLNIDNGAEYIPYLIGGETTWSYARIEDTDTAEEHCFAMMAVRQFSPGTHSIKFQIADIDATPRADWQYISLLAIKLTDVFTFYSASTITQASTTSTTLVDYTTLNIPSGNAGDYLILGGIVTRGSSTAYSYETVLEIDGVSGSYGRQQIMPQDTYDYVPKVFMQNITLNSNSHTVKTRYRTLNSAMTVYVKNSDILAIKLEPPKYELDLEVQWINVDPPRAHEYLCIRTGSLDAEALRVDFWNGSTWVTIIDALSPNQWNNVSVSAYLTSPIFTLRFVGSAETVDSQQSIWQIDSALLWLWDDSYSVEVEFTGTSNATESWTRLDWTVDGSFTVDNVNVILQLFNYATNSYSTSGDGCISYISGLANVDETRTQSITVNPAYFRDSDGNWKLRVIGVKATSEQFEFRADMIQLRVETQGEGQQQNFTYYTLSFYMNFALDLAEYSIETVHSIEAHVRLKVSDTLEGWLLEAYNWADEKPEIIGGLPPSRYYRDYVISFGDNWQSYINTNNGTVRLMLCDESPDDVQTTVDVGLLTLKVILKNGTVLTLKNEGSVPVHIIAIWVNNATFHKRYKVELYLNPGEAPPSFLMGNINLPNGDFTVRIVTERGNMAVFTGG